MCGIAGIIGNTRKCTYENIQNMLELQKHRGPDDRGILGFRFSHGESTDNLINNGKFDGVLGFNRLSIRDLSINGHQPMQNNSRTVTLAFNGEIYNADEHREALVKKGYPFRGNSDTEVILNLYLEYGLQGMLKKLNGMFAIVIVDLIDGKIYIARDRVGIKPMYYYMWEDNFLFSSEIKSFLGVQGLELSLDHETMQEYLAFRNVRGRTLAEGVFQVNPGEVISYDYNAKKIVSKTFFFDLNQIERTKGIWTSSTYKKQKEKLNSILKNAVKSQLVSDVKVGCQLSGGVDSSLISYYAKDCLEEEELYTISVIFNEKYYSEEKYIDQACKNIRATSHKCEMNKDVLYNELERAIWHLDTIIAHPNAVGVMQMTREAKKDVTVLLSGEGADELMGGYSVFANRKRLDVGRIPYVENAGEQISGVEEYIIKANGFLGRKLCQRIYPEFQYDKIMQCRMELLDRLEGNMFDKQVKYEMMTYLPEVLIRQDKMSMSNSIENRVPMLDNNMIDFALVLPEEYLLKKHRSSSSEDKLEGKYILKGLCANYYGESFTYRPKCGFHIPFEYYFREANFKNYIQGVILTGIKRRGILNYDVVDKLYRRLPILNWYEAEMLWKAINIEIWCQLFLDKRTMERTSER